MLYVGLNLKFQFKKILKNAQKKDQTHDLKKILIKIDNETSQANRFWYLNVFIKKE